MCVRDGCESTRHQALSGTIRHNVDKMTHQSYEQVQQQCKNLNKDGHYWWW
jgi:hypothetical protein